MSHFDPHHRSPHTIPNFLFSYYNESFDMLSKLPEPFNPIAFVENSNTNPEHMQSVNPRTDESQPEYLFAVDPESIADSNDVFPVYSRADEFEPQHSFPILLQPD
mmetsp:Transcript_6342/g.15321  ORF Transcript_6342/g.15321 Transcript_6342/m.15321 type:complete len:105 (-) Transcript_6342:1363-1677(-)